MSPIRYVNSYKQKITMESNPFNDFILLLNNILRIASISSV